MIQTKRLTLRPWQEKDIEPFAALNADPRVMEYFPSVKNYQESLQEYELIQERFKKNGWGYWAVSRLEDDKFIGMIGLKHVSFDAYFTPAVEVSWRLAYEFWGYGYATEGATSAIKYGFETLNLDKVVSLTVVQNQRSRRVMERIGMVNEGEFNHPLLPEGHHLQRHALYTLAKQVL